MNKYRKLPAWQRCHELAVEMYRVTKHFPAMERFGLTSQLRRAAVSAAVNIAQGYARFGTGELAYSLSVALGELAEIDALMLIAREIDLLGMEDHERLTAMRDAASRETFCFQRSVRR